MNERKFIHNWKDTFDYKFRNDELIITRTDQPEGLDHNHSIDICFTVALKNNIQGVNH